jgi:adenosylmethionine-8-amino-7-oxononanoate aminotransferase
MSDFLVVGTDTDAGKTTFALLWMTTFVEEYGYWKPVETGESDTQTIRRLVPAAQVLSPLASFDEAVAPPLAAKRAGKSIPPALQIASSRPSGVRPLLIETFGGPLSPLNDSELQISLIKVLSVPCVLISSSQIGAVGRTLATLQSLISAKVRIAAVVLIGPRDEYSEDEIAKHGNVPTFGLGEPAAWETRSLRDWANECRDSLDQIREVLRSYVPAEPDARSEGDAADGISSVASRVGLRALTERDRAVVWHPYTPLQGADDPLQVVAANEEFIELADGRRLIDAISSWWTILHGHRQPRLMASLELAARSIDHVMFAGVTHRYAVECAELLMKTAPWPDGRVFFSDNGSTAVEVALKMAYQFWCHSGEPQRRLFVGLEGGYHGDTFGAMAISRDPVFFGRFDPLLFESVRVPPDPERLDEVLATRGSEVGAVIVEPLVLGAGGMRMYSADNLTAMHAVCRKHGILFIADEVMTCGRTGSFWAHTQAGIAPDLICAAKTLAGGVMPLAATLVSPTVVAEFEVADRAKTFFHGHSFTGHPLSNAVAVENLKMMSDGVWMKDAERIQAFWQREAIKLGDLPKVNNVRTCGTILAMDVNGSDGYLADSGPIMRRVAIEHGVLLRPLGNVLYAMPPLCTSDESLARIIEAMRAAVSR